ncbi:HAD family hydrolase [Candidatus Nanosalina sp. VS9-1]|uniref:HAD family hydrolase n=1 Tax=Candidatus Nanosalina sp. VS9-1 TaxID=3388566 RepID=UPI0039E0EDE2
MKYGSVILDMDGVILNSLVENEDWKFSAVEKALNETGINPERLSRREMEFFLGDHGREKCIEACKKYDLDPGNVWKLIAETTSLARIQQVKSGDFRLYSDARVFLDAVHREDRKLGLISNAPESAVETTMKFFELKAYFDFYRGVESFSDLKLRKPHPDHIQIAEAELKQRPSLYIGDKESDIEAAKNAGIDAALVNRSNIKCSVRPEYEVDDLEDLGRRLEIV